MGDRNDSQKRDAGCLWEGWKEVRKKLPCRIQTCKKKVKEGNGTLENRIAAGIYDCHKRTKYNNIIPNEDKEYEYTYTEIQKMSFSEAFNYGKLLYKIYTGMDLIT